MTAVLFSLLFACLIGYYGYFLAAEADQVINNPYNTRIAAMANKVIRGNITDRDGNVLATSQQQADGSLLRVYPYNNIFAQSVGYSSKGGSGLESAMNFELLSSHSGLWQELVNDITHKKGMGDTVVTTLDAEIQQAAYEALGDAQGAVVALEPDTGKILAMVSKPDYNPNQINEIWDSLVAEGSTETCLLNRASQGLYPPGSTFKILTALEYIREHPNDWEEYTYECDGCFEYGDYQIRCSENAVHGHMTLRSALAMSCNGAFANMADSLDKEAMRRLCDAAGYNSRLDFLLPQSVSSFPVDGDTDTWEMLQSVIGQGKTQTTPLQNALVAASVANGGVIMKPYLVDRVVGEDGSIIEKNMPESMGEVMTPEEAELMTELMVGVINEGTGAAGGSSQYQVAGKTGSAQFDSSDDTHALFIGFAPAENPEIVVSVVVEKGGSGGRVAAPIAKAVMDAALLGQ